MKTVNYPFVCSQSAQYLSNSFTEFMKHEIHTSHLRLSTRKNHYSTWKLLASYCSELQFSDLTYGFLCGFEEFLVQHDLHCNTIAKHMKHLKRYVNVAINKDLIDIHDYPFRKFKIKHQESQRSYLTPEELLRLEMLVPHRKSWQRSLDMFLFSCYTGLRFSDIVRLQNTHFQEINGKLWLVYSTRKTDAAIRLPLYLLFQGKAVEIYRKYSSTYKQNLFDSSETCNSNVNKQLKKLCRSLLVGKNISFHTARHTHATLLLYQGANITTVQKLLGHKSVRTTEIYSKIMDMTIIRDLEHLI